MMRYSKQAALEHIFTSRFDPANPQSEIPFTRDEVRAAIIATGGTPPDNLNNFVKDLTRTGKSDPRSPSAKKHGYRLREGSHSASMGVFFLTSASEASDIAVSRPPDLQPEIIPVSLPVEMIDLIRPDEGGVVAILEHGRLLERFFGATVYKVQSPVKVQPHELDSFFLLVKDGKRIPVPCEAKSRGNDLITLNQIVGVTAATLQRLLQTDMEAVIPIGVKLEANGDLFIVSFPACTVDDLLNLQHKLTAASVTKMALYRISPLPLQWR